MSTRKTASARKPNKKASARAAKASAKRTSNSASAQRTSSAKKAKKKPAAKTAPKKGGAKKAVSKKKATPKKAAKGTAVAKKTLSKKATPKKKAAKKAGAKKQVVRKTTVKQTAKTKTTAKKVAKKVTAKKAAPKKATPKKAAPKTAAPSKAAAKKATPSKAGAKGAPKKTTPSRAARSAPGERASKTGRKSVPAPARSTRGRKAASEPAPKRTSTIPPSARGPKVELTPRSSASVLPTIPIPVKEVPRKPTLEERAKSIESRIQRQSTEFRERFDEEFDMSWIYHDTALEGVVYTFEELTTAFRSDEVTVVDSSVMPIYDAIRRHKGAIQYVRDAAVKKNPLTVDTLKAIYIVLHPEEGDVKTLKYRRDVPQHRLYFHEYAAPDKIAYKVRNVVDWVNDPENVKNVGVLRVAAKAHYDLGRTYPFAQDSGKVARLFMNLILMRAGFPPAIIHATERQRYYEALKASNPVNLVQMLRDSVDNAVSSIEKLLDEHETNKRGFVS